MKQPELHIDEGYAVYRICPNQPFSEWDREIPALHSRISEKVHATTTEAVNEIMAHVKSDEFPENQRVDFFYRKVFQITKT